MVNIRKTMLYLVIMLVFFIRFSYFFLLFFVLGRNREYSKDTFVPTKECTIRHHWCLRTKPTIYPLQPLSPCDSALRYYFAVGWLALRLYHVQSSGISSAILWLYWLHRILEFNTSSISRFGHKLISRSHLTLEQHIIICSAYPSSST